MASPETRLDRMLHCFGLHATTDAVEELPSAETLEAIVAVCAADVQLSSIPGLEAYAAIEERGASELRAELPDLVRTVHDYHALFNSVFVQIVESHRRLLELIEGDVPVWDQPLVMSGLEMILSVGNALLHILNERRGAIRDRIARVRDASPLRNLEADLWEAPSALDSYLRPLRQIPALCEQARMEQEAVRRNELNSQIISLFRAAA